MRKSNRKVDIIIVIVLALAIIAAVLFAIIPKQAEAPAEQNEASELTPADFANKNIGIVTGSRFEPFIEENYPNATISYFNNIPDLKTALLSGKTDAFLLGIARANVLESEEPRITHLDEAVSSFESGIIFPKTEAGDKLRAQMDEFLTKIKGNGQLDEILAFWQTEEGKNSFVDTSGLTGENGILYYATTGDSMPCSFLVKGQPAGHDPDIAVRFCREYGYDIDVTITDFSGEIAGVVTGMYDFAGNDIVITEERKEGVNFSIPYISGPIVMMVKNAKASDTDLTIEKLNSPQHSVGFGTGSAGMFAAEEYLPNAKKVQFSDHFTGYEAVRLGKIDAYVFDRDQMEIAIENGIKGVTLLPENLGEGTEIAVGLSKNPAIPNLKNSLNDFIAQMRADGSLDEILERWVDNEIYEMPDIPTSKGSSLKIVVGTTGTIEPYSFYKDNQLVGFDIELARRFAAYMNADIEFKIYDFGGIVAAAETGDIDCIFSDLNVTPERKEVIDFSNPVILFQNAVMVASNKPSGNVAEEKNFFESIAESFEKNFIREERWKMILEGIGTTCLITALSAIFGSILAFLICMFRRTGSALARSISNIYVKLLQGTPMVVLLMILYYLVFGKTGISAVWVAIIGFTLNFGAYASEIMRSGIESIDGGQREAALALGYSENQAFFKFIFPQAAVRFLPVYNGEIVSLLKSTSIVGYIAIQDLTKMSDIIRSRTYEAFFPLIATAIIYFLLAWIISLILKFILKRVDSRRRKTNQ